MPFVGCAPAGGFGPGDVIGFLILIGPPTTIPWIGFGITFGRIGLCLSSAGDLSNAGGGCFRFR